MSNHTHLRLARNNFDLLRLLFAGVVCLVHAHELSGFDELGGITGYLSSSVAVKAFFVVSGFLIFMSHERSSSLTSYLDKRVRRVYPAYFVTVMLCAILLLGASTKDVGEYVSFAWAKYVVANLAFLNFVQPTLPGVFESNKLTAVNGALWTLKIEALFYLTVPVIVFLFSKYSRLAVLAFVYCASVAYAALCAMAAERTGSAFYLELGRQLPGQLCYFISGAALYYFLPFFERWIKYFLTAATLVLLIDDAFPLPLLEPFALASVVIFFGLFLYVGNFGKFGDFSYGLYILHFPVIQLILHTGVAANSPWHFLTLVLMTTAVGAIAMWHLVEKRFLLRSSHYVAASHPVSDGAAEPALQNNAAP